MNLTKLNTKLNAITAKDQNAIISAQITIPRLTKPYILSDLQAWITKRTDTLNTAKTYTEQDRINAINILYGQLDAVSKAIADKIIAGENFTIPDTVSNLNYDRLVGIILLVCIQ